MSYSELRPAPIRATAERLARRIDERFRGSGLSLVAAELLRLAQQNEEVVEQLRRPLWWLRALSAAAIITVLLLTAWGAGTIWRMAAGGVGGVSEVLEAIDAATSELILLGLIVFFFASLETRLKRRTALRMLHRLRSIAHVVDMHQLTKDPEHVLVPVADTPSSPARDLSRGELARYLDYCSELLALTSKLAALHAQHLQDPVVLNAVNDIESLTADLSRKVWHKITILDIAAGHDQVAGRRPSVASS
jgi:hypothetical protein